MTPAIPAAASRCPMFVLTEPDQQRPARFAAGAEHRTCGLDLDRVAQRSPGAVCLQVSDVAGFEIGALQRIGDDSLLGNAVRHRQPARCAVLVDRAAADHGPNPVTVANRVLEPLDDDDTAALAAHVAVRGRVEGLAPAVGREHVRTGERDHGRRGEQDVRAAGQREVAFAQAQRLARLMDGHQRRAARRVDGDRGTLQPQPIADPSRCCGIRRPDGHVGLDLGVSQLVGCHSQVVVGGQTHEHPGVGTGQEPTARYPNAPPRATRLQQQPMLRVHHPDLARRHTEERRVEPRHVVDETRTTGHDLAGHAGFRVEEFVDIPAVLGHLRYRVAALAQQVPERVCIRGTWKTRRIADDGKTRGRIDRIFGGYHLADLPAPGSSVDGQLIARLTLAQPRRLSRWVGPHRAIGGRTEGMLIPPGVMPERSRQIEQDCGGPSFAHREDHGWRT